MLRILIVEDVPEIASALQYLIEGNACYQVVGIADDAQSALAAVADHGPDLVLLDLHLARGTSGFTVAAKLAELQIMCLFVSGKAPKFSMPDLAIGCLAKPFTDDDVLRSIAIAEDLLRGHETLRSKMPPNLKLYGMDDDVEPQEVSYIPSSLSFRTRIENRLARWAEGKP